MARIFSVILFIFLFVSNLYAEDVFRVGVIQSLTGIAAEDGKTVVQSLQLAAEHINSKYPNSIELFIEDDQSTPKNTLAAYYKLKSRKVEAIIGATWDFTTYVLIPQAAKDKIVLFNTSTLPESLNFSRSKGYLFSNAITTAEEAEPFKRFLVKYKPKSLVIVYANNLWGETQKKVYKEIAVKQNVKIEDEISSVSFEDNVWREVLPRIKSKNPSLILLLLNKNDIEIFLRRAKESSISALFFASKNAYDALSNSKQRSLYERLCFTYPYERLKRLAKFNKMYKDKFGELPRIYADNTYDALWLLYTAYKLKESSRNISLREALKLVRYKGLVGIYRYSPKTSFSIGRSSLVCVKEGKVRSL
ncbi:MAG: amino acid ABC transporter substrate-binding protein [Candidatus Dadabacteria bacterium]|nr:MAG: amino acid ABC transporter substrate-binding protein [Candidatus Dadabacteria bacterium]